MTLTDPKYDLICFPYIPILTKLIDNGYLNMLIKMCSLRQDVLTNNSYHTIGSCIVVMDKPRMPEVHS
jgi:hypothetical protein